MTRVTKITDGTNTIDFEDANSGYAIVSNGWRPAVARRNSSGMGETYEPVDEEMRLSISGATPEEVSERINLLAALIDQAEQWKKGENVDPVILQFKVQGSTLSNPLQAAILGYADGPVLELPGLYDHEEMMLQLGSFNDPVILRFRRRGLWLGDEESDTEASPAPVGTGTQLSWGPSNSVNIPAPIKVAMDIYGVQAGAVTGYLLLSTDVNVITIHDDIATGGTSSATADTYAYGGSYRRYNAGDGAQTFTDLISASNQPYCKEAIYIAMIENSSTVDWNVQFGVDFAGSDEVMGETKRIEAGSGIQYVVFQPIIAPYDLGS